MNREYIELLARAVGIGLVCGVLYAALGWAGLAGFAILALYEISDKLGDIRDRLRI